MLQLLLGENKFCDVGQAAILWRLDMHSCLLGLACK